MAISIADMAVVSYYFVAIQVKPVLIGSGSIWLSACRRLIEMPEVAMIVGRGRAIIKDRGSVMMMMMVVVGRNSRLAVRNTMNLVDNAVTRTL